MKWFGLVGKRYLCIMCMVCGGCWSIWITYYMMYLSVFWLVKDRYWLYMLGKLNFPIGVQVISSNFTLSYILPLELFENSVWNMKQSWVMKLLTFGLWLNGQSKILKTANNQHKIPSNLAKLFNVFDGNVSSLFACSSILMVRTCFPF